MRMQWLSIGLVAASLFAAEPIDWNKARDLYQREQRGEQLSPEDSAYLQQAKALRQRQQRGGPASAPAPKESTGLIPFTDAKAPAYKGFSLGLYGDNRNTPPEDHLKQAMAAAAKVKPLDAEGTAAPSGKIVLMSVGMSNTTQAFSQFVRIANADPRKSRDLVIVDAAQGGQTARAWADPESQTWREAQRRLAAAGVGPSQVQALWVKQALAGPASLGEFPKHAEKLEADLKQIVLLAKQFYPNLQLIYFSSRTYGGWATTGLNPEPYAYEGAFSVQWLLTKQIKGSDADLAYGKAPVLLWGPYLWTDGIKGRQQDQLIWAREDTAQDGTHPSRSGQGKGARQLLDFFTSDSTAREWFLAR